MNNKEWSDKMIAGIEESSAKHQEALEQAMERIEDKFEVMERILDEGKLILDELVAELENFNSSITADGERLIEMVDNRQQSTNLFSFLLIILFLILMIAPWLFIWRR